MLPVVFRHRHLIWQFARREILARYRGSAFGLAWALAHPLIMLAAYALVFGVVFRARWGQGSDDPWEYALALYAGLVVHGFLAECLSKAPALVTSQPNLVKKVIFPLEILPWAGSLAALFHFLANLLVLLCFVLVMRHEVPATAVAFPVILLVMVPGMLGAQWFLSATAVYLRDVGQVVGLAVTLLLFVSPIFYPLDAAPSVLRAWLLLSPLTVPVEAMRAVLLFGRWPDWGGLAAYGAVSMLAGAFGWWWFERVREGFADAL